MIKDTNEIHYTNDDPLPVMRYTNEDIPYNEWEVYRGNPSAAEFGDDSPPRRMDDPTSTRFSSDYDIQKIASTFVVVSLVAMAVVLDDSPFGSFFDPIMGSIAEAFGVSGIDPGYSIYCEVELIPTDSDISYYVTFDTVPEGKLLLKVTQGKDVIQELPLESSLSGTIVNLLPGTTYVVSVLVDGKTAGSAQTSTLGTYDGTPIVKLLSYKNNNKINRNADDDGGYLNFQIAVIDRNSVCSSFGAEITVETAAAGPQTSFMTFTGAPTDMQVILLPDDWFPSDMTEPIQATLVITWDEGGQSKELSETISI